MKISVIIRFCLLLLGAEIGASFFIWSGSPTDWIGEPLHFWSFEGFRLRYWALVFASSGLLWVVAWHSLYRRAQTIVLVLGLLLAAMAEVLTSIWYWKQLSWNEASYLGWLSFRLYLLEHLFSWFAVAFGCLVIRYLWTRSRGAQPTAHHPRIRNG